MSEKQEHLEGALPTTVNHSTDAQAGSHFDNEAAIERRKQWKLRRLVAFGFLLFACWQGGQGIRTLYSSLASSTSSSRLAVGSADVVEGYFDRVAGSKLDSVSGTWAHEKHHKHDKHHKEKHHKHGKHDHDKHGHHHGDKHGHGGRGHGHHGPSRWISPKEAEEIFLTVPSNDSIRADARKYTSTAHPAGSGFDYITALQVKSEWERSLGLPATGVDESVYEAGSPESQSAIFGGMSDLTVWIDTYYPVLNTPVSASVTLLSDPPIKAKLKEDIVQGDPDSVLRDEVPVFHGLSVSGDVTGQVIYVGYGRKRDFEALQARGVDFTGKIALVRYGGNFRGLKIKAAQEAGAVGCLIFTDPGDDGEITEENGYEQYPNGPARQPSSVQRGSVQFLSKYPGDPSTPGEPAYKNATRLEGGNQPSIPSLPMSYEDAIPILNALKGHGSPAGDISADWVGGLGFYGVEYFTGPSEVELHLVNEVNTRVMPIWNTMAVIPGHISDEVLVIGNHRDAWVLGAGDPNSGTAAHNEMVKGFGTLLAKGWKPLRTIVLASWDAEEYGLIGSTEWAEDFGEWLKEKNAVYLNVDVAVSGPNFKCEASPSLAWLIRHAAQQIQSHADKNGSTSVWDTRLQQEDTSDEDWKKWQILQDDLGFERLVEERSQTGVKALGSGSDYTAFLQRYGVASGDIGYTGGPKTPVYHYHSIYDSFAWQEKYGDPGFHKHVEATKILGLMSLRVADSLVLPLNTTQYAIELRSYLDKVLAISQSTETEGPQLKLSSLAIAIEHLINTSKSLDNATESQLAELHKLLPPPPPPHHRHQCGVFNLKQTFLKVCAAFGSERCEHALHPKHPSGPRMPKKKEEAIKKLLGELRKGNKKRQAFEGGFISEQGIKEREWYKHKGTAPGIWLGYGATTFPALTEALTIDKSTVLAQKEADELTEMIIAMAKRLAA